MELRMSRKERDRLKVVEQIKCGSLSQQEGARLLRLSPRQLRRIMNRHDEQGDRGLVHRGRGRTSNRRIDSQVRARAVALLEERYHDFGPTLAAEHLAQDAGIVVSRETVRQWMLERGLWSGTRPRRPHRRRRPRRACFGELVQMDTSAHGWLEGRGPEMVLITMIDDATGRKLLRFFPADTTAANMELIGRWVRRWGRPVALYTDWASHFKQTRKRGQAQDPGPTQIERALSELDIVLIAAHSPQAKGRVERSHATDQDRLIKKMRLAGIHTLEAANRFLEEVYLPQVNERFTVAPLGVVDAHRCAEGYDLEAILSLQEERRVNNDATVQIDGRTYQIEPQELGRGAAPRRVRIERRIDGTLRLRWGDRYLKYHKVQPVLRAPNQTATQTAPQTTAQTQNEPPPPSLLNKPPCKPAPDHPWRKRTVLLCSQPDIPTLR
jgi:hypothetical protein